MLTANSNGVINPDVYMEFIRNKYVRLLVSNKKINASIIKSFVNNLLRDVN